MSVVVLAGGTGGAKLARGMLDVAYGGLSVIANTGDDIEMHGVHVSPDPDLVCYWLADEIDAEQGWGIRGDTYATFDRLVALGSPGWFRLGDRDLAACLLRTAMLRDGARLTEAQGAIAAGLGVPAAVLPMSDDPVRTHVRTPDGWRGFQEYLILDRAAAPVEAVEFRGADRAAPTVEVTAAIAAAEVIVIGPSNPICSIGPMLALPALRRAVHGARAPVVAVSPFVAGRAIKGPTEIFMRAAGLPASGGGVASAYSGLIDGLITDERDPEPPPRELPTLSCPTLMDDASSRRGLAERVLEFAASLAPA